MRKHIPVVMAAILVLALATAALSADDPFVGTWKLTKGGGNPPPKSLVYTIEARGSIHKMVTDRLDAEGKATHNESTRIIDGKVHPMTNSTLYDSSRATRVDANTVLNEFMKEGKVLRTLKSVVSKDGKVMMLTMKGKDAQGKDFEGVDVLEKQ